MSVATPREPIDGFISWITVWPSTLAHIFEDWNLNYHHAAGGSLATYVMIVLSGNNQELKVLGKIIDTVAIRPVFGHSIIAAGRYITDTVTDVWTFQNAVSRGCPAQQLHFM
jgi:hypothetical protein